MRRIRRIWCELFCDHGQNIPHFINDGWHRAEAIRADMERRGYPARLYAIKEGVQG